MRIISLWQPWASLIALELKQCETRSWGTEYRGKLLIHATKTQPVCVTGELERIYRQSRHDERFRLAKELKGFSLPLPQGAVVALVDLTGCYQMTTLPAVTMTGGGQISLNRTVNNELTLLEEACGDWQDGRFAWQCSNVQQLDPIPWMGAQGLRSAPLKLIEMVEAQLGVVA